MDEQGGAKIPTVLQKHILNYGTNGMSFRVAAFKLPNPLQ